MKTNTHQTCSAAIYVHVSRLPIGVGLMLRTLLVARGGLFSGSGSRDIQGGKGPRHDSTLREKKRQYRDRKIGIRTNRIDHGSNNSFFPNFIPPCHRNHQTNRTALHLKMQFACLLESRECCCCVYILQSVYFLRKASIGVNCPSLFMI